MQIPGSWDDYQTLSQQLGDRSIPCLKYRPGEIWFMSPLPEHGRNASLVADAIKAILDRLGKEYDAFTSIFFLYLSKTILPRVSLRGSIIHN